MRVIETTLAGVRLLEPTVFRDDRGLFLETFRADRFAAAGIPDLFVQDNTRDRCAALCGGCTGSGGSRRPSWYAW